MAQGITPKEADQLVKNGRAVLSDLREPDEFGEMRIPGALPLMRQVHIAAGVLIVLSLGIGQAVPLFRLLTAFIGAGLLFSGLTGVCGMAALLMRMPWNASRAS
jgi:hypothetical protein